MRGNTHHIQCAVITRVIFLFRVVWVGTSSGVPDQRRFDRKWCVRLDGLDGALDQDGVFNVGLWGDNKMAQISLIFSSLQQCFVVPTLSEEG